MLKGRQLKLVRIMKDIKQQDVAKALGVSRNYISMMENQERSIPEDQYGKWIDFLNGQLKIETEKEVEKMDTEADETTKVIKKQATNKTNKK